MTPSSRRTLGIPWLCCIFAALAVCAIVPGCGMTQQVKVSPESVQTSCAFLGNAVCTKLTTQATPGQFSGTAVTGGDQPVANLRYIDPNARWTQYSKVLIQPV